MGSAIEIYRRPLNRFVADFIGRANFLPVTVVSKEQNQGAKGANVLWQVKLFAKSLIYLRYRWINERGMSWKWIDLWGKAKEESVNGLLF